MSERAVDLFGKLVGRSQTQSVIPGTVTAVDLAALTCAVQPDDGGAELLGVRLRPVLDGVDNGLLVVPAEGSAVVVLMLDAHTGLLTSTSAVQLYSVRTERESLKAVLSDLLDAVRQLTVPTPAGPSGVPINTADFGALQTRLNNLFSA